MFRVFESIWGRFKEVADTMAILPKVEVTPGEPGTFARALNMVLAAGSLFAVGALAGSVALALVVLALSLALMWVILVGILGIRIELNPDGVFV